MADKFILLSFTPNLPKLDICKPGIFKHNLLHVRPGKTYFVQLILPFHQGLKSLTFFRFPHRFCGVFFLVQICFIAPLQYIKKKKKELSAFYFGCSIKSETPCASSGQLQGLARRWDCVWGKIKGVWFKMLQRMGRAE